METYQFGDVIYVSSSALVQGDYSGSGSMARSNQRVIDRMVDDSAQSDRPIVMASLDVHSAAMAYKHRPEDPEESYHWPRTGEWSDIGSDVLYETHGYDTVVYYLRTDDGAHPDIRAAAGAIEDYPILDESDWSEIEDQERSDAADDIIADLLHTWDREPDLPEGYDGSWLPCSDSDRYGLDHWLRTVLSEAMWSEYGEWYEESGPCFAWRNRRTPDGPCSTPRWAVLDAALGRDGTDIALVWCAVSGPHVETLWDHMMILQDFTMLHGYEAAFHPRARDMWASFVSVCRAAVEREMREDWPRRR